MGICVSCRRRDLQALEKRAGGAGGGRVPAKGATAELLPRRVDPAMANSISNIKMTNPIKGIVSKRRKRYIKDGFNLDLAYITERLIAMGFPAEKLEGVYRNHIDEVFRFLEQMHKDHYKIYNLCSERCYDSSKFHGRVARYAFEDHTPPKMELIQPFCEDVHQWLNEDPRNVAAVHCKAGKGRTGTMVCCYLLYCGQKATADEALKFYGTKRTHDEKGVTIPSQRRYVEYYAALIGSGLQYSPVKLHIRELVMSPPPALNGGQCTLELTVCQAQPALKAPSGCHEVRKHDSHIRMVLDQCTPLQGDVRVDVYNKPKMMMRKEKLFHFWFNTFFVANGVQAVRVQPPPDSMNLETFKLTLNKWQLDDAHKDKMHKIYSADFKVEVILQQQPLSSRFLAGGRASPPSSTASDTTDPDPDDEHWDSGEHPPLTPLSLPSGDAAAQRLDCPCRNETTAAGLGVANTMNVAFTCLPPLTTSGVNAATQHNCPCRNETTAAGLGVANTVNNAPKCLPPLTTQGGSTQHLDCPCRNETTSAVLGVANPLATLGGPTQHFNCPCRNKNTAAGLGVSNTMNDVPMCLPPLIATTQHNCLCRNDTTAAVLSVANMMNVFHTEPSLGTHGSNCSPPQPGSVVGISKPGNLFQECNASYTRLNENWKAGNSSRRPSVEPGHFSNYPPSGDYERAIPQGYMRLDSDDSSDRTESFTQEIPCIGTSPQHSMQIDEHYHPLVTKSPLDTLNEVCPHGCVNEVSDAPSQPDELCPHGYRIVTKLSRHRNSDVGSHQSSRRNEPQSDCTERLDIERGLDICLNANDPRNVSYAIISENADVEMISSCNNCIQIDFSDRSKSKKGVSKSKSQPTSPIKTMEHAGMLTKDGYMLIDRTPRHQMQTTRMSDPTYTNKGTEATDKGSRLSDSAALRKFRHAGVLTKDGYMLVDATPRQPQVKMDRRPNDSTEVLGLPVVTNMRLKSETVAEDFMQFSAADGFMKAVDHDGKITNYSDEYAFMCADISDNKTGLCEARNCKIVAGISEKDDGLSEACFSEAQGAADSKTGKNKKHSFFKKDDYKNDKGKIPKVSSDHTISDDAKKKYNFFQRRDEDGAKPKFAFGDMRASWREFSGKFTDNKKKKDKDDS